MGERTVLCYGDSNTHGTMPMARPLDRRRFGPSERWPGVLAAELGPDWRVIEEGLPGRTTVHPDPVMGAHIDGLAVLPAALESHRPIDIVVLMLGTNDLKTMYGVAPLQIADSASRLVAAIRQSEAGPAGAGPGVLLVCPPPVLESAWLGEIFAGGAAKSERLAPLYAEVAARHGAGFLDAGTVIRSSPVDGVHFKAEDHARLGRAVAEALAD